MIIQIKDMKKIILLAFILFMVSCDKQPRETHKYEILLSTKDTVYIDAQTYYLTSDRIAVFKDASRGVVMTMTNPVYIKEIK